MIPVLSLIVAGIAVFVGPLISWWIASRQLSASLEIAMKQIVAPMRQAWINSLRDLLSELASSALHYHVSGFENRTDSEYQRLTLLEYKIKLMLNANEDDHQQLEKSIATMTALIGGATVESSQEFQEIYKLVIELSRNVLKREWDRVKGGIALTRK